MAKFEFDESRYAKLWNSTEGRELLNYILNDPNLIHSTPGIWSQNFDVDPFVTPTASDGTASFTVKQRPLKQATLMHATSPLGDTITAAGGEGAAYSGTIGQFVSTGYRESAIERKYRKDIAEQMGTDKALIDGFITTVQNMIDGGYATLDYLSAFALSHGYLAYDKGKGLSKRGYYKAAIPEANFKKAGAKVWSASDCALLTQMRAIEKSLKEDTWGIDLSGMWQMTYSQFHNIFLANAEVQSYLKDRIKLDRGVDIANPRLVYDDVTPYLANIDGLSPIVVVESKQYDGNTVVSGWDEEKVVFRPAGYAGKILRTNILDEEMYGQFGNEAITRSYSWTSDGLMLLENSVHPNGDLKEWQSAVKMAAMPVLDEFMYHSIIDITTAD